MRRPLTSTIWLLLVLVVALSAVTGCKSKTAEKVPASDAESTAPEISAPATASPDGDVAGGDEGATTQAATPPASKTPSKMKVKLYFGYEDRVLAIEREVPYSQAVAKTAMTELLKGPSAEEMKGLALHSEIPKGTKLLGVTMSGRTARVDLSEKFDDGGGTLSMTMRLAQVVYTLTQYSTIESVEFYMNGKRVEVFSGEGIMLDSPQRPTDYYSLIPIDA